MQLWKHNPPYPSHNYETHWNYHNTQQEQRDVDVEKLWHSKKIAWKSWFSQSIARALYYHGKLMEQITRPGRDSLPLSIHCCKMQDAVKRSKKFIDFRKCHTVECLDNQVRLLITRTIMRERKTQENKQRTHLDRLKKRKTSP